MPLSGAPNAAIACVLLMASASLLCARERNWHHGTGDVAVWLLHQSKPMATPAALVVWLICCTARSSMHSHKDTIRHQAVKAKY